MALELRPIPGPPLPRAWEPTTPATIAETVSRKVPLSNNALLLPGRLHLAGGMVLPGGVPVNGIVFCAGTQAAVAPTNQFFCLVRPSDLSVLIKTVDDLTTAWNAGAPKPLATSAPYIPGADMSVYVGIVTAAGTAPSLLCSIHNAGALMTSPPILSGFSTTGLTTPASLGATAGAITASAVLPWAAVY